MNALTYGDWLRQQRKLRGHTQESLGDAIGKHRTHINRIETGGIGLPDEETRDLIHAALGTSEDDLVAVGILERISGSHTGPPVYIPASSITPLDRAIRDAAQSPYRSDSGTDRVRVALQGAGLSPDQYNAVVTILEAFWAINEQP